jgi:hypothetical protein
MPSGPPMTQHSEAHRRSTCDGLGRNATIKIHLSKTNRLL